eukprot:1184315-Prorocentrum_minimum.AAC.1
MHWHVEWVFDSAGVTCVTPSDGPVGRGTRGCILVTDQADAKLAELACVLGLVMECRMVESALVEKALSEHLTPKPTDTSLSHRLRNYSKAGVRQLGVFLKAVRCPVGPDRHGHCGIHRQAHLKLNQ